MKLLKELQASQRLLYRPLRLPNKALKLKDSQGFQKIPQQPLKTFKESYKPLKL